MLVRTVGVTPMKRWAEELAVVGELIGSRFSRSEPRRRVVGDLQGLL